MRASTRNRIDRRPAVLLVFDWVAVRHYPFFDGLRQVPVYTKVDKSRPSTGGGAGSLQACAYSHYDPAKQVWEAYTAEYVTALMTAFASEVGDVFPSKSFYLFVNSFEVLVGKLLSFGKKPVSALGQSGGCSLPKVPIFWKKLRTFWGGNVPILWKGTSFRFGCDSFPLTHTPSCGCIHSIYTLDVGWVLDIRWMLAGCPLTHPRSGLDQFAC